MMDTRKKFPKIQKSVSKQILVLIPFLIFFSFPLSLAFAQTLSCAEMEEFFGFKLDNYPVDHQGGVIADIDVSYRLITNPEIDLSDYPDFLPIARNIQEFISNYPNETDYWEVLNRQLAQSLLDEHPQFSALQIKITIQPLSDQQSISYQNYERFSMVRINRPNLCPLNQSKHFLEHRQMSQT